MTDLSVAQLADEALHFIRPALRDAGRLALVECGALGSARFKEDGTPVTQVDHTIEDLLVERIHREFPQHRLLAEEGSIGGGDAPFIWVIDPLDGTRAYVSGLPIWGISVGLLHHGAPIAGAFYLPAVDELVWGDSQSAFLNDAPLSPPDVDLCSRFAFLAVPSNCHLEYEISYGRLRSLGSTAAHLAYVARGAAVGALTRRVRVWDIAGVLPMLRALGIELRYLSGARVRVAELLDGRRAPEPILAASPNVIDHLQTMIRPKKSAG